MEQGSESIYQGAGSEQQRADSRDQRAESGDQTAENRQQSAGGNGGSGSIEQRRQGVYLAGHLVSGYPVQLWKTKLPISCLLFSS